MYGYLDLKYKYKHNKKILPPFWKEFTYMQPDKK